jgi:cation transport ATPase
VGVEEKLRKGAVDLMKYFHRAMMKIFILSGDVQSRVVPVAYKTGIMDKQ